MKIENNEQAYPSASVILDTSPVILIARVGGGKVKVVPVLN
jgi:hypothetical protein